MYPSMNLETAVRLAKVLWDKERRHAAAPSVVAKHWDYSEKSSGGMVAISALKQFGLLVEEGDGNKRALRLSDLALEILKNEEVPAERAKLLKVAALKPGIYRSLWASHKDASDDSIIRHLEFDLKFNSAAAPVVVSKYRETIKFAKLGDEDIVEESSVGLEEGDEELPEDGLRSPKKEAAAQVASVHDKQPIPAQPKTNVLATYKIPLGGCVAEVSFTGDVLMPRAFERLAKYVEIWKEIYETEQESSGFPRAAIWKNADHDKPVSIVGVMGEQDGVKYYKTAEGTGVPETELTFA